MQSNNRRRLAPFIFHCRQKNHTLTLTHSKTKKENKSVLVEGAKIRKQKKTKQEINFYTTFSEALNKRKEMKKKTNG